MQRASREQSSAHVENRERNPEESREQSRQQNREETS
jgi:hypothetical protein